MKKIISVIAVVAVSIVATASKTYQNSGAIVYHVHGENVYHTSAEAVRNHALIENRDSATIMMQRESGCKQSGMHKCLLCKGAELINSIK